jgi:HAD superfamily hydrolase (TIGR01490 family)
MANAFFDLDNTLIRGSSMYYLARVLVRENAVSKRELGRFASAQAKFIRSKTEDKKISQIITERALTLIKGRDQCEIFELVNKTVDEIIDEALYKEVVEKLMWHTKRGDSTWLVTASPIEIAFNLAKRLKMNGALGTVSEVVQGKYTGKLQGEVLHGPRKARAVYELSTRAHIDLNDSYGYSDSLNDLPLLCTVSHPVVVNPNAELLRIANKNNWTIINPTKSKYRRLAEVA